jgi:CHAD domain-containing protein
MAAVLPEPTDLAPFAAHIRRRRTEARRALVRGLRSERFTSLRERWRAGLAAVIAADHPGGPRAGQLAEERLRRAFRRAVKAARAITPESEPDQVHDLRKKCKEMRYVLELFQPICDRQAYKQVIADFKGLQNVLGAFQDGEVQAAALRRYAQEMMDLGDAPASALLAMGDLAARFEVRQREARAELSDHHDEYLGPRADRHVRRLLSA